MKPPLSLLVNVDDIKDASQPWEADLPRELLDEVLLADPPTEFHAGGAAHARAKLTRMGRKVLVRAGFTVPLAGLCKRCLKPVALDEPVELTLTYVPAPDQPHCHERQEAYAAGAHKEHGHGHGGSKDKDKEKAHKPAWQGEEAEASFDPQTADEEHYTGKSLDLLPALREGVLLAVPPSPLCSEACLGLCAVCGVDRNERDCGHSQVPLDPRFAALKNIVLADPKHSQQEPKKE